MHDVIYNCKKQMHHIAVVQEFMIILSGLRLFLLCSAGLWRVLDSR